MSSNPTFNNTTTAEDVISSLGHRAKGKYVIITGANTGLGLETARVLAKAGTIVTIAARNEEKAIAAVKTIKGETPNASVTFSKLDLGSLKSIKAFTDSYLSSGKPLHLLINNAGVMACPLSYTTDGFEMQFGTNHIGHFALTIPLLDLMHKSGTPQDPSRVVNVASVANVLFSPPHGIHFDDLDGKKHYNSLERYGQSKLANILFTAELNNRLRAQSKNVYSVALHPGNIASTDIKRHLGPAIVWHFMCSIRTSKIPLLLKVKNIPEGSATTITCALDPKVKPDEFYSDCQPCPSKLHEMAYNPELSAKLWAVTEELVKGKY